MKTVPETFVFKRGREIFFFQEFTSFTRKSLGNARAWDRAWRTGYEIFRSFIDVERLRVQEHFGTEKSHWIFHRIQTKQMNIDVFALIVM